jgi:Mycotoxin biosynthesis protein UstYa
VNITHDGRHSNIELWDMNKTLPTQHAMVSVFHQMHCLVSLDSESGEYMLTTHFEVCYTRGILHSEDRRAWQDPFAHLDHCFDYIRQAIMCFSDMTLEWLSDASMGFAASVGSTAWGYQHTCREYEAVKAWAAEEKWKDTHGIHKI